MIERPDEPEHRATGQAELPCQLRIRRAPLRKDGEIDRVWDNSDSGFRNAAPGQLASHRLAQGHNGVGLPQYRRLQSPRRAIAQITLARSAVIDRRILP